MFYENPDNIISLAEKSGFSIFSTKNLPENLPKNAYVISPGESHKIAIDDIRAIIDLCKVKRSSAFFVIIKSAEFMNEQAENALLKLLEEPAENYHFVLFTDNLSALLPTILSRADVYVEKIENSLEKPVIANEKIKKYAKCLISANNSELPNIVKALTDESEAKKSPREFTLNVLDVAIEILYKSYFATKKPVFLKKLPYFLEAEENIRKNGHVKLHLVADLC